jgi:hypothetical protein
MSLIITPQSAVLQVARGHLWVRETNGSNRGEVIDEMIRRTSLDPKIRAPWCAAFVAYIGYLVFGKLWPLARVAGCVSLYEDALKKGLVRTTPSIGSIGLLFGRAPDGKERFKHAFLVDSLVADGKVGTIEGNTNGKGSVEGDGVFEQVRLPGVRDVFVNWWE